MADNLQSVAMLDEEFLELLLHSEFYKNLDRNLQERLILIVLTGDEESKFALLNILNNAKTDFDNLKNNFLKQEFKVLNEQAQILTAAKNLQQKVLRIDTEVLERQKEEKNADDLLKNI
ncbi:MAG: hypothetical protein UR28_C0026G0015 [Candidatus Peregrinibacteria bacterium GW2011_GWF2_33_10]|nr:MAG: hypothetical protein UR28_C0026G0015 [Candidatus Peregrinibacteria bacterium GW2011_GWF2_33_10]OGJ44271.1 MAG: hypothetical protein A2263_05440 [Candidatus Peregrinibacteria bacterium RIFOXYA2_FULL_33_21]OGJ45100.1 MAG: hypothetical protein A2272_05995 [Candidatus Peregrinibacteria bacterium RIFOXYA12_FULL_33_12]OGJ50092.1 MAG: hypothetical protein A2307_01850 [Candidatus Peregrinibacteria bacterium RIFOXYB2_FULL_33_20]